MRLHHAYRFALDPSVAQRRALASHVGAARFAFNWGLEQVRASMALRDVELCMFGEVRTKAVGWSLYGLRREWNQEKERVAPWWRENSKEAYGSGLAGLARALASWSASRQGTRSGPRMGFPRFRSRSHPMGCRFTTGAIRVDDEWHITLPRLGRIRTGEATTALLGRVSLGTARVLSATVSPEAGRWYVSFGCEVERRVLTSNGHADTVGVDLGVLHLATLSTGEVVEGPRALRRGLRRLRRLSRHHARCRRGSANRRRAAERLARQHARIAHLRRDHLHQLTTRLAKSHGRIVIEDLNVAGMSRSARGSVKAPGRHVRAKSGLSRSLADASFGELRRMLTYKCRWYGAELLVAGRFFASSKTCSHCGTVTENLSLADRTFHCAACGLLLDRDLNAAINLAGWVHPAVAPSAGETENAWPRGGQTGPRPARPDPRVPAEACFGGWGDAGTGIAPEPADLIGGRIRQAGLTPAS
ncbi:MAG: IS607 family element RNA-guided endonuclease TnpB [Candidatus Dormibacteria bacterium]